MIVFENLNFIAADKPCGWLTVPSRAGEADARRCLGVELSRLRAERLWPVHRLDAEVSGVVLFARTAQAHRAANTWFEGRAVTKTYEAWTEGKPELAMGETVEWRSTLLRGKKRAYEDPRGKPSVTRATVLGTVRVRNVELGFWRLEPLTGRPHQLRHELAKHGHPVAGDALYGAKLPFVDNGIALRAVALDFSRCPEALELGLPVVARAPGLAEAFGHG